MGGCIGRRGAFSADGGRGCVMMPRGDRSGRRVQLHRALSKLGWGSRGQAWVWIQAGEVRVDDRVVTDPLTWVDLDRQRITRNNQTAPLGQASPVVDAGSAQATRHRH